MRQQIECPEIEPALIEYLRSVFPDTAVDPEKTNPYQAYGRAEVIRHLDAMKQRQEEEPNVRNLHTTL